MVTFSLHIVHTYFRHDDRSEFALYVSLKKSLPIQLKGGNASIKGGPQSHARMHTYIAAYYSLHCGDSFKINKCS